MTNFKAYISGDERCFCHYKNATGMAVPLPIREFTSQSRFSMFFEMSTFESLLEMCIMISPQEQSDERLKKSNEVFQSIKLLKLYAWENIFRRSIEKTRRCELKLLLKAACYRILSSTLFSLKFFIVKLQLLSEFSPLCYS